MSKSPAFQWYAADYLADERVMLLSLESEAAYVRLLSLCWREGSIPAKPELCAPLCKYADVKVIKPALALFMKSPGQPGRLIHKRLEEERAKQEEFRARQSAKGAKGGRPRKPDEKPEKAGGLPGLNPGLTGEKPDESTRMPSSSSSSSTSTKVDEGQASPAPEPNPLKAETGGQKLVGSANPARDTALAVGDGDGEQPWDESPLTKPHGFQAICEGNGYPGIDYEHYRKQALDAARNESPARPRTPSQWRSWVRKYLNFESKGGPLLQPSVLMPTVPTPKHELPQPGKERRGQVIAIQGVPGDQNMNRMLVATYQSQFPSAVIHAILPRTS